jgi:proteasome assembly chaperone 3
LGQLFATQIASTIAARNPEEKRLLVVGSGLRKREVETEFFLSVVEMVMECL